MEAYPLAMAKSDEGPVESRTYSVEEVGAIIRRATTEKAAPPTSPLAGADWVSWPDLVEIAGDLDISEHALRRAATPEPPATPGKAKGKQAGAAEPIPARPAPEAGDPPQPAVATMAPVSADPLAAEKARFKRRAAHDLLTLGVIGVLDLLFLTHGVLLTIVAVIFGVKLGRRAIDLYLGPHDAPARAALPEGGHADWREYRRAARHARRAERHAWKAQRHARRAERYKL